MGMVTIELTQGKVAMVDDSDASMLLKYSWFAHNPHRNDWYAIAKICGKSTRMHRLIMAAQGGVFVDHIDHNGLNNQRANLRLATNAENCRNQGVRKTNKSGFKGVFKHRKSGRWVAQIYAGKIIYLGVYDTAIEAARVYDESVKIHHGDFGITNASLGLFTSQEMPSPEVVLQES